jgi:hypothetical protein
MPTNDAGAARQQFDELVALPVDGSELTVYLGSVVGNAATPKIEQLTLGPGLLEEFTNVVLRNERRLAKLMQKNDLVFNAYDGGSKPDPHEVEVIKLSQHEEISSQLKPLDSSGKVQLFKADAGFVAGLRFYVIVLRPPRGRVVRWFRIYTPKKQLQHSSQFAAMFGKGVFDRVLEPMFLFDHEVDCVSRGDLMFILSKANF